MLKQWYISLSHGKRGITYFFFVVVILMWGTAHYIERSTYFKLNVIDKLNFLIIWRLE